MKRLYINPQAELFLVKTENLCLSKAADSDFRQLRMEEYDEE